MAKREKLCFLAKYAAVQNCLCWKIMCSRHEIGIIPILLDEEISITECFFSFPQSAQTRPETWDLVWVTSFYNSQFPVKVKPRVTMSFLPAWLPSSAPTFPQENLNHHTPPLTSTTNWLTLHFRSWISRIPTRESSCWWWWPPRRRPRRGWAPAPPSPWRWRTSTTTVQCLTWIPIPRPSRRIQSQVIIWLLLGVKFWNISGLSTENILQFM